MTLRLFGLKGIMRAQAICDGCGAAVTAPPRHPEPRGYIPDAWAWVSPVGPGHVLCAKIPNPTHAPCQRHHSVYLCNRCEGALTPRQQKGLDQ